MRYTKLNHLLDRRLATGRCPSGKQHCWAALGDVRASMGGNMIIYLHCRDCSIKETVFLTNREYKIQERVINNSIKEQQEIR